jgi:hypothetical protein
MKQVSRLLFVLPFVLVAACGQATPSAHPAESPAKLASRIELAASRSSDASSVRLEMRASFDGEQILDGTAVAERDGSVGEGEDQIPGVSDVRFREIGRDLFYTYPDIPAGYTWVEISFDQMKTMGIDLDAARAQSGAGALAAMSEVSNDVHVVGAERVGGVDTTHYRFTVNVDAISDNGVLSAQFVKQMSGLLGHQLVMDSWIDASGLVRRLSYEVDLAKAPKRPAGVPAKGTIRYSITMSNYNEPVHVDPPPAPTVISFADYRAQGGTYPQLATGN